MLRGTMTLDKAQMEIEMAKDQAISRAKKKFIDLRLLDPRKNRIQGAMILKGTPIKNHITNLIEFHFQETGGPLVFNVDQFRGGSYCRMLDCEHNRQFLASMFSEGFWEIEDEKVREEIKVMAEEMAKKAIKAKESAPVPEEARMTDEDLEAEMARLQAEKSKRTLQTVELKTKKRMRETKPAEPAAEQAEPEPIKPRGRWKKRGEAVTLSAPVE